MMSLLPTGTVTFLFTDIVGSTNIVRKFADSWHAVEARHNNILETAIRANHGFVFQIIGDEFQAAFATAQDALAAGLAAQVAFRAENWGEIGSLHVRMGVHTGSAVPRDGKYDGYLTLAHAKRLMSAAYGDQILVSEATEVLLNKNLPQDVALRNLGKHRLKDFEGGEMIYQVVAPHLPADFPPLKLSDQIPNNLPIPLTSFIGRSRELGEIKQILSTERLVTLTGPGGSGKTRLALRAAAEMVPKFQDGVFFSALASITDPALVALTIAQSCGITEAPGRSVIDSLKEFLQKKSVLLVLDNFEQVIAAAPLVAELLTACKELKVLVTSREGLRISGEREVPVPPLELPNLKQLPPLETLSQYPAVALFLQRAKEIKPNFRITNETFRVVAEICHRLDGLPLAIELAAARIKLLTPRAILDRMEDRLEFLTGGRRELPERQQTLRNAIAWSYDLLQEEEQQLFRRLSVFVGGCTIDAVEAVAGDSPTQGSLLDRVGSLLDKSLLLEVEGTDNEPRFVLLETLRAFGQEQLQDSGEQDRVRRRHANYYLTLAEQAKTSKESVGQVQWMNQMEQEHDNLRAALTWCSASEDAPEDGAEICLRLADALGSFWEARGYYTEGRERLAALLRSAPFQEQTAARARLLARSAELAYRQSDFPATKTCCSESLSIYREVGDTQGIASALIKLGNASTEMGNYVAASKYLEEALKIWRERKDQHGTARALISFGWAALRSGDYALAKNRLEEALAISRGLEDTRSIAFALAGLGEVALRQEDYQHAAQLVEESLDLRRQLGNKWGIGVSLGILGWIAMREENWEGAKTRLGESLEVRREIGDVSGSAWCLERLAAVVQAQGETEKAARLFGAAAGLRASIRSVIDPTDKPAYESKVRSLRAEFGKDRFAALWAEGQTFSQEQAAQYALE